MASQSLDPVFPAPYWPSPAAKSGPFVALEGVGGSGKSTVAAILAGRWQCPHFHTAPAPFQELQPYANTLLPLPHLAFYLTAVLRVSDLARQELTRGPVIADRYISSVIANHSAVQRIPQSSVTAVVGPFLGYLIRPDVTVYLHTPTGELRDRLAARAERERSPRRPPGTDLLDRLTTAFDEIAAADPTAIHITTSGRSPQEIAEIVADYLTLPAVPTTSP